MLEEQIARSARTVRLEPCDDGFAVIGAGNVGFVFPDPFSGWRPYSVYGHVIGAGRPAFRTPEAAAAFTDL